MASSAVAERITMLPSLSPEEIRNRLDECHIAVFPSIAGEPFSNALLEAMSMGLAVITTDVGGFPEAVSHDSDGLMIPAADSAALATSLAELIESPEKRRMLGLEARRTVSTRFGAQSNFDRVVELLRGLLL